GLFQIFQSEAVRHGLGCIHQHDGVHPTTRAVLNNADQTPGGRFAEVGWKVEHYQDAVRFSDFASVAVVVFDISILVAQVLLDDVFHVFSDVGQTLLNVVRFGPSFAGNETVIIIGQMHEGRGVLPQTHRINES